MFKQANIPCSRLKYLMTWDENDTMEESARWELGHQAPPAEITRDCLVIDTHQPAAFAL